MVIKQDIGTFSSLGKCQELLDNEIWVCIKPFRSGKREVFWNFPVAAVLTLDFRKLKSQITSDSGNFSLNFKQLGFSCLLAAKALWESNVSSAAAVTSTNFLMEIIDTNIHIDYFIMHVESLEKVKCLYLINIHCSHSCCDMLFLSSFIHTSLLTFISYFFFVAHLSIWISPHQHLQQHRMSAQGQDLQILMRLGTTLHHRRHFSLQIQVEQAHFHTNAKQLGLFLKGKHAK